MRQADNIRAWRMVAFGFGRIGGREGTMGEFSRAGVKRRACHNRKTKASAAAGNGIICWSCFLPPSRINRNEKSLKSNLLSKREASPMSPLLDLVPIRFAFLLFPLFQISLSCILIGSRSIVRFIAASLFAEWRRERGKAHCIRR